MHRKSRTNIHATQTSSVYFVTLFDKRTLRRFQVHLSSPQDRKRFLVDLGVAARAQIFDFLTSKLAYKLIKSMMTSIDFNAFADLELHYRPIGSRTELENTKSQN